MIRRLRALGQPATLFGEEDADRQARLRKVEKTVVLADEARGGQQENVLLKLRRQEKQMRKGGGQQQQEQGDGAGGSKADAGGAAGEGPSKAAAAAAAGADGKQAAAAAGDGEPGSAGDDVLAAFKAAAERLAAQRAEESLPVEERMVAMLQRWCKLWEEDLEARSEEVRAAEGWQCIAVQQRQVQLRLLPVPALLWPVFGLHVLFAVWLAAQQRPVRCCCCCC